MGPYEVLDSDGRGRKFGHFMFNEICPTSAKQEVLNTFVNEIQHTTIKFNFEEIKRLQQVEPHYPEIIEDM